MSQTNQQPIAKIQVYWITAAIWKNTTDDGQTFYSFTLERIYKKAEGRYHTTRSFNAADAVLLAKVVDRVDTKIRELREADQVADTTAV